MNGAKKLAIVLVVLFVYGFFRIPPIPQLLVAIALGLVVLGLLLGWMSEHWAD